MEILKKNHFKEFHPLKPSDSLKQAKIWKFTSVTPIHLFRQAFYPTKSGMKWLCPILLL